MINDKAKFIITFTSMIDREVNNFLQTIDVRQIIKIEITPTDTQIVCLIMYLDMEDIRESKIESILDKKQI
jgi:hypothetical protein